jgi:transposase-like protein
MKNDAISTRMDFDAEKLNLISLAQEYSDNDRARALLESLRWPNGVICPHCKNDKAGKPISKLTPKTGSRRAVRKGVYFCGACRKQFTVTVGTVFEATHVPINKWLMALFLISSSKKGMSAHQLHRMLKVSYKTAWFMAHRIRFGVSDTSEIKLDGIVEVDETFGGGKGRRCSMSRRKTPVVALVERDGSMKARVVNSVTAKNLGKVLSECVSTDAIVHTDEHPGYRKPLKAWKAHHTVVHSKFG